MSTTPPFNAPHVVIVGGGFGGLYAARALAHEPVRVTVVDRNNYHLFQPLLYQVATAALSPGDVAEPIRAILRKQRNAEVLMADVQKVEPDQHRLVLAEGELAYDYLVLATGSSHSYFGHDEWAPLAPGLKTLEDALEIRRRILSAFEAAERCTDLEEQRAYLTFVIVGGGPTGVELAGAIAEIARHTVAHDYRRIDPTTARIVLVEGGPRVLAGFTEDLSRQADRSLRSLGVEVLLKSVVTGVTANEVKVGDDQVIRTHTALWGAGVHASPLVASLGVPLDRAGRVTVEPDLTVPGHPEIYAIGDLSLFTYQNGKPLPGLAPVAMQQGTAAAKNIARTVRGEPRQAFKYWNRGTMATIGRATGVGEIGPVHLHGLLGWLAWLFIHLFFLIGFQNRVLVLMQWAWSYWTYERGARLITRRGPD
jgi:NADH dehydrogenase